MLYIITEFSLCTLQAMEGTQLVMLRYFPKLYFHIEGSLT